MILPLEISFWYVGYDMIRACSLIFTILSVFMSPEVSLSLPMTKFLSAQYVKQNIVLVAIDEANCITDW